MKYPRAREGGGGPEANRTKDPRCNLYFHDSYYRFNATLGLCTDSRCTEPDYKFSIYMKKCMDRQATGRVDKLFGLMVDHGLDISRVTEKIWPLGTPFLDREGLLWHQALKEEGLDPRQISALGLVMPKYPRSWLPKFAALNRTKRFRYNWQGAGLNGSGGYRHRGLWMPAFAKAHFDARDFFRWTDPRNGYEQLGPYDHTGEQLPGGFILRKAEGNVLTFDEFYFATLAGSQFTVAPGGDGPCTLRFYEAIAAGSIPLVPKEDAPGVGCRHPYSYIPYKYATDANLFEYSEQIVQDNYRLLLKYQTFTEGDNVPPKAGSNW